MLLLHHFLWAKYQVKCLIYTSLKLHNLPIRKILLSLLYRDKELMLLKCGVGEDSFESLGLQDQSILKEISLEYSLEGLVLKLKLYYFGHLMWRNDSLEKTLMLGKTEGRRRKGWQRGWEGCMASPTWWTWVWESSRSWWMDKETWHTSVHGVAKSPTQMSDWTELNYFIVDDSQAQEFKVLAEPEILCKCWS